MNLELEKIISANDLPDSWDQCAMDYFQKREFLKHTEKFNPSQQRYYLLTEDQIFKSGLVIYSLKLDLLTFLPFSAKINMNISGIPCSVSASGLVGDIKFLADILTLLKNYENGFQLFLNLDDKPGISGLATGRTLPTIIFEHKFSSFEDYISSIKSSYRRRYKTISGKFRDITIESGPCSEFTKDMYQQYLEVLKRSKGKLETLSHEFFAHLPAKFQLTHFYDSKKMIGWHITLNDENKFYYFLGGIDYTINKKYNSYFNILFNILKQGIESGASIIDFGQTAEIPKLRLGGKNSEKYMMANHSNLLLKKLLIAGKGMLSYSSKFPATNVIKDSI